MICVPGTEEKEETPAEKRERVGEAGVTRKEDVAATSEEPERKWRPDTDGKCPGGFHRSSSGAGGAPAKFPATLQEKRGSPRRI
ncbi:hypothetical protein NDU88_013324 [Pleurodeles waltl]|uniref:Uncharacterized protein n=1 Tax=Pleurodeles waltl TaxID=8319 RepID=A0AAV7R5W1_PLEWA|nr:hypothetical protein NDU88_013324 [Pleurodeles waltl]